MYHLVLSEGMAAGASGPLEVAPSKSVLPDGTAAVEVSLLEDTIVGSTLLGIAFSEVAPLRAFMLEVAVLEGMTVPGATVEVALSVGTAAGDATADVTLLESTAGVATKRPLLHVGSCSLYCSVFSYSTTFSRSEY